MFNKSNIFYDELYSWKNYTHEAKILADIIEMEISVRPISILDAACGTGSHIKLLSEVYHVEGLDVDPGMIDVAKTKIPNIRLHTGDMTSFTLAYRFDVILVLFSSIAYVRNLDRLIITIANLAKHLSHGGILIVEPYFTPATWKPRTQAPAIIIVDKTDIKIVRMMEWENINNIAIGKFHYMVGTAEGIEYITELHEMALFTPEEYHAAFSASNLVVSYDQIGLMGRGLYIGKKP